MRGFSKPSIVYHNNFLDNNENAWSAGERCRNKWNLDYIEDGGGNFWDDYKGKDRNGDNIGDKPYIIPDGDFNPFNNDKDKFPLMVPDGRPDCKPFYCFPLLQILLDLFPNAFPILRLLMTNLSF